MSDPATITKHVHLILESVQDSLPAANVTDARELLEHAEWGEALSLICTQLYEYDITITRDVYHDIERTCRALGMPPKEWEMLRDLIV